MDAAAHRESSMNFDDLETRYGYEAALVIVKTLEQFEGILESRVSRLPPEIRLENVLRVMGENLRPQTRH